MSGRLDGIRARVAGWFSVEFPDEPLSYRSMLTYQLRAGAPALPGPLVLVAYYAYVYGPEVFLLATAGAVGVAAAFTGGLALRWNDRGYAAGCLLATASVAGA